MEFMEKVMLQSSSCSLRWINCQCFEINFPMERRSSQTPAMIILTIQITQLRICSA